MKVMYAIRPEKGFFQNDIDVHFSVIVFVRYIEQGRVRPLNIRNKSTFIDASVGVSYIRCNMDIIMGHIPHRMFLK